jgi:hypothetical protein
LQARTRDDLVDARIGAVRWVNLLIKNAEISRPADLKSAGLFFVYGFV